jgi:hypothetical protein
MGYSDIALLQQDFDFARRTQACYAVETLDTDALDPASWQSINSWDMAAQPGFGEAYAYAIQTHPDDPDFRPGNDPSVITDAQILAAVQSLLPDPPEPPVVLSVTALEPNTASIGDADFEGHIRGTGFTEETVIVWGGGDEPTHFVDSTNVWTTVKPSVVTSPTTLQVTVRDDGVVASPALDFVWTESPTP